MKILNFGSLNLDFVYAVDHIVNPGETISSSKLELFCGGKGLNQSIALARAGANVLHAGMIGPDGDMLMQACLDNKVDASLIRQVEERSGNAIIQVAANGQNSIVLFGGANRKNTTQYIDSVLQHFNAGDYLLLQNEINLIDDIMQKAAKKGLRIALNPSPFDSALNACDLNQVSIFIMNEVEGAQITGQTSPNQILTAMKQKFPQAETVLTLGGDGSIHQSATETTTQEIFPVKTVDTTAAGDTFTGYFLAARMENTPPAPAMRLAAKAASIAVSRPGAVPSIPHRHEVSI